MATATPVAPPGPRVASSRHIAIGILSGAALGLFIGERASILQSVADAYVRLLQMMVLPYVTLSIIGGLGSLDAAHARTLGLRVGLVLMGLWAVALAGVLLFPLMFPSQQNAAFFSTALLEEREPFDLLNLYIPTNPFYSLANNVVPAVVLFSLVAGVALIGIPDKAPLLSVLRIAGRAVSKAMSYIVLLTPYGMFALAAVVAGTLRLEELERLQVYLISYACITLLLSVWVLPALVAALTPIPYRAVIRYTRDALVMAFMTASLFAVLPLIVEQAKALVRAYAGVGDDQEAAVDVIVPASFNVPHTGKILTLSFVLFAGWFSDLGVPLGDYPRLAGAGLLAMFGNVNASIPFLLDLLRIPADTFHLFLASAIVNARFGTLVAAMHTLTVAVLGTCAVSGTLRLDRRKLIRLSAVTVVVTAAVVGGTRFVLQAALSRPYSKDAILTGMGLLRSPESGPLYESQPLPPREAVTTSVLDRVRASGVLRVGYFEDSLPYVFVNRRGELVGFDVEMALELARDLGVRAELTRVGRQVLDEGLDPTVCDLVMSGVAVTAERSLHVAFSPGYLDETVAFIVRDNMVPVFSDWSRVRGRGHLRLAVPRTPYFIQKVRDELTDVEILPLDRLADMFEPGAPAVDAIVATAERGSAYTLLHPQYSVAVPKPRPHKVPLAYVVAGRDSAMAGMLETWIDLKRKDGTIDKLFAYWILGQNQAAGRRRWSVLRDVLHWTE